MKLLGISARPDGPAGQQAFTVGGQYEMIVPENVVRFSAVCVGAGKGLGGGGLSWRTFDVTPGETLQITVGSVTAATGVDSMIRRLSDNSILLEAKGSISLTGGLGGPALNPDYSGGTGGKGATKTVSNRTGNAGGGAGGYSGNGGDGAIDTSSGGSVNAGGGGGASNDVPTSGFGSTSFGGGVGILGKGVGGASVLDSGGNNGSVVGTNLTYGAGGGRTTVLARRISHGAVRIIWGPNRAYPTTNVLDW